MSYVLINTVFFGQVFNVKAFSDFDSTTKMWEQVDVVYKRMKPVMDTAKDGVNLICFSQGMRLHFYERRKPQP